MELWELRKKCRGGDRTLSHPPHEVSDVCVVTPGRGPDAEKGPGQRARGNGPEDGPQDGPADGPLDGPPDGVAALMGSRAWSTISRN